LWIAEAMNYLGYPGSGYFTQVRDFINSLRNSLKVNWAFAIFVVDSWNDPDGCFTDQIDPTRKWSAYAYLGGPFLVMTYDNDGYGINNMDYVTAHETCHIFYATDEYNGRTEISGYLGVQDLEGSGCMMERANTWWLCTNSTEQLGWRDSDGDGIQDIVDTFPDTFLNPYSPDPTTNPNLVYNGTVAEIPYPNNNPYGTGRDVTINTITNVEYRVDGGPWQNATPSDAAFDEAEESFSFTTTLPSQGTHTIETRGTNLVGNVETSYGIDIVTWIPPDIAVMNVTLSKTIIGQGFTLYVNVTVQNQGTYTETFDVTAYANTTEIGTQTVTLTSGNSTTITFTWNTTGFAKGNYTISAYAWPLRDETDVSDNNCTNGWTVVTIPGDVDGNFEVDIYDVTAICVCYDSKIGPPRDPIYYPNCDLDGNGVIDIFDVTTACITYGQKYP
jgi:hypothetical protein